MRHGLPLLALFATLLSVLSGGAPLAAHAAPGTAATCREPAFRGTFLQPLSAHASLSRADWNRLFAALSAIGVEEVVVQWSVHDNVPFYDSATAGTAAAPVVAAVAEAAPRHGIRFRLGLIEDPGWWKVIQGEPAAFARWLKHLRIRNERTARELAPLVSGNPGFAGWYLPQEVDDSTLANAIMRAPLTEYFARTSAALRRLTPDRDVAVSGFSNGRIDPKTLAALWKGIAPAGPAMLLFQDGVGVGKLRPEEAGIYLAALRQALEGTSLRLVPVMEIFVQTGGPPLDDGPFAARPAALHDVLTRLHDISATSSRVFAFSLPEYMSPLGGEAAAALYEAYRAAMNCAPKKPLKGEPHRLRHGP